MLRLLQRASVFILFLTTIVPCVTIEAQEYNYAKLPLFSHKENVIVRDIERDSKGFVWYIADGKVYRYDGYTSTDLAGTFYTNQALNDIPQYILADKKYRLWIAGINSLSYLDLKTWVLHKIPDNKLPSKETRDVLWIKEFPNGNILAGYASGHVLLVQEDSISVIDDLYQKGIATGTNINARSANYWKGKAWIGSSEGSLLAISLDNIEERTYYELPVAKSVEFILAQKDQLVLDIFESNIYRFTENDFEGFFKENNSPIAFKKRHELESGKNFTVYARKGKVVLLDNDSLQIIHTMEHISSTPFDVFDVKVYEEDILVATSEGIFVFYPKIPGITSLIPDNDNNNKSVRSIYKFSDGSLFYLSYGASGYISSEGKTTNFPELSEGYAILPIDENKLLLGIEGGFLQIFDRLDMSLQEVSYSNAIDFKENKSLILPTYVHCLSEDEKYYYLGTTKGLWLLNKHTRELYPFQKNNSSALSNNLHIREITITDKMLLLSTHQGLLKYEKGLWEKIYPKETNRGVYAHIFANDTIWMATQGNGIVAIDTEGKTMETIDKTDGLSDNLVYSLIDVNGYKVAGTSNGLSIIKDKNIKRINTKDGIGQNEFNHSATFYDSQTKQLYVGGLNGYTILDMNTDWFQLEETIANFITQIHITNTKQSTIKKDYTYPYNPKSEITLSPDEELINIFIGTPKSYKSKERLQYKLNNNPDFWQSITAGRPISLMGFSPEEYELFIATEKRANTDIPIKLQIVKTPAFYQTWWFQTIVVTFFVWLVWLWFENKKRKLKKEHALRTKISSDLHDEVGSLLTGISMQAEFLQISKKELPKNTYLKTISDSCKSAIDAMGDIVWSIDARNDNWKSLIAKLRQYAYHLLEPAGIDFSVEEKGASPKTFLQQERHAIYLIVKEALNNIVKHAKADRVTVIFEFSDNAVSINIKDNGKGFYVKENVLGQGLKNMKNRAEKIKAQLTIVSSERGTEIQLLKKSNPKNYLIR